jgi:hypothetical protein
MKTIAQPAVITPTILGLAILFAAVGFIGITGKKVPLLSNARVDIILLVIIGMNHLHPGWDRTYRRNGTVDPSTSDHRLHPRRFDPDRYLGRLCRLETPIHSE